MLSSPGAAAPFGGSRQVGDAPAVEGGVVVFAPGEVEGVVGAVEVLEVEEGRAVALLEEAAVGTGGR